MLRRPMLLLFLAALVRGSWATARAALATAAVVTLAAAAAATTAIIVEEVGRVEELVMAVAAAVEGEGRENVAVAVAAVEEEGGEEGAERCGDVCGIQSGGRHCRRWPLGVLSDWMPSSCAKGGTRGPREKQLRGLDDCVLCMHVLGVLHKKVWY